MRTWIGVTSLAVVTALALTAPSGLARGHNEGVRVAVVTGGGYQDALALDGLAAARKQPGVEGRAFVSPSPADDLRTLSAAARQGYDLVVVGTPAMAGASLWRRGRTRRRSSPSSESDRAR